MTNDTCPSCGGICAEGVLHDPPAPLGRCVYCGASRPAFARCVQCAAPICWNHGGRHPLPMCDAADVCVTFSAATAAQDRLRPEPGR